MRLPTTALAALLLAPLLVLGTACAAPSGSEAPREPDVLPSNLWTPARALLERSLAWHDPAGLWGTRPYSFSWVTTRPDGTIGYDFDITLLPNGDLAFEGTRAGHRIEYRVEGDTVRVRVDGAVLGRDEIAAEVRDALVLDREGGRFWQGYLGFLGALPFCLDEPDVFLEEEVAEEELDGRPVLAIRAHFQPGVGTDRWTFWFEPETAELVGCRFDRADPNKAGETILFERVSSIDGLRVPRTRRWFVNGSGRFLGSDVIAPR